jgi:hemin uptake protein HemP
MNSYNPNAFFVRGPRHDRDVVETPQIRRQSTRVVTSQSLFEGDHEIGIDHGGSLYRLKITRQGKLILNK